MPLHGLMSSVPFAVRAAEPRLTEAARLRAARLDWWGSR